MLDATALMAGLADLSLAYSNTNCQFTALVNALLNPANQTSNDSDPLGHKASEPHPSRQSRAIVDRLGPKTLHKIVQKFRNGYRQADLAIEYAISVSSIKRILKTADAKRYHKKIWGRK